MIDKFFRRSYKPLEKVVCKRLGSAKSIYVNDK